MDKLKTSRKKENTLESLSPFELKDSLIALASENAIKSTSTMLNAGRGNPNFIATVPREAFFLLGNFALNECKSTFSNISGLAGLASKKDIAKRFEVFLASSPKSEGIELLSQLYRYGIEKYQFSADDWVYELVEGCIGCQYPSPGRISKHVEPVIHDYLIQEMCNNHQKGKAKYDLFAIEGGTAGICYAFDSLLQNGLLKKGDKIALGVPTFTPYLEIPELERYALEIVYINGNAVDNSGTSTFQYSNEELDKLGDKSIKAFFIVNPSNPTSVQVSTESQKKIVDVVKNLNPNLMILTDDVYGTFVPGFTSLMDELPHNTICVYSFSKYFGATGWRLGIIALHEDNIYDKMISALPDSEKQRLVKLYSSITLYPEKLKFIDRMLADSRQVALNHTAGLSTPQQIQMLLFAAFALFDKNNVYKNDCINLLRKRYKYLVEGMNIEFVPDTNSAHYYCEIDIHEWGLKKYGQNFIEFLEKNFEPVDFVFRLAEKSSIVLLNGGGFDAPQWSVRISLANLNDEDYKIIGEKITVTMNEYVDAWKNSKK